VVGSGTAASSGGVKQIREQGTQLDDFDGDLADASGEILWAFISQRRKEITQAKSF
jgi:hypothetical protein